MKLNPDQFVNLHVHTQYSFLDGVADVDDLMDHVKSIGQTAVAITDHGVMCGVQDFYKAAKKKGIKPIIGIEGYLAKKTRFDRDPADRKPYHQLLLAMNMQGYQNLLQISSDAMLNGFYYRPRTDKEYLESRSEGIIATSGCLAAELPQFIMADKFDEAETALKWWLDVFGDRFYLEVQPRDQSVEQKKVNKWLIEAGQRFNVPVIATTDAHYIRQEDAEMHDLMLCIQTSAKVSDTSRMRFEENSYWVKDTRTMQQGFRDTPYVVSNTRDLADRIDVEFGRDGYHLPNYPVPAPYTASTYLAEMCKVGLEWRYGTQGASDEKLQARLDYELSVIDQMGFPAYFLVVWDMTQFCRTADIWWNVRGSGAGSLVAYCLGITAIDPILSGLFFERFLNPTRVTMPDIDIDLPDNRRAEVVKYFVTKYGADRVAGIITFSTLSGKNAVRDASRALGVPLQTANSITSHITVHQGKTAPLADYERDDEGLATLLKKDPEARLAFDWAKEIQDGFRGTGTHAAALIVSKNPLVEHLPLHRITSKSFADTGLKAITQFPMETCEEIGLLKMDLLGLSTLSIMRLAAQFVEERHGIKWTIDTIPYRHEHIEGEPDKIEMLDEAFRLISKGHTAGIFQLESAGMTKTIKDMQPTRFENIVAAISLYRPGPIDFIPSYIQRMHGEEETIYHHEKLEPILSETFGHVVYQEQIISIAKDLFGYAPGDADKIRKAVSKKNKVELESHHARFLTAGPENGISEETSQAIWDLIIEFANYGFNKAHASDYAKITMQMACMKSSYPLEFMMAMAQVHVETPDKITSILDECRKMDIMVLPPDINYSHANFALEITSDGKESIRCGLTMVKSVGESQAVKIIQKRGGKPFLSLGDLLERVNLNDVNKIALMNLVKVGAFRRFGDRYTLVTLLDTLRDYSKKLWADRAKKQARLFDFATNESSVDEFVEAQGLRPEPRTFSRREGLDWERELIGFYVTERPTDIYADRFSSAMTSQIVSLVSMGEDGDEYVGQKVKVGGEITDVKIIQDKRGRDMAFLVLQDWHATAGQINLTFFADAWAQYSGQCQKNSMIVARGKLDNSRGSYQVLIDTVQHIADS